MEQECPVLSILCLFYGNATTCENINAAREAADSISPPAFKGWTAHVVRSQVAALISLHKAGSGLHVEACSHIRNAGKPGEAQCSLNALVGHK
eukprot:3116242-Rhodomonas_salina.1